MAQQPTHDVLTTQEAIDELESGDEVAVKYKNVYNNHDEKSGEVVTGDVAGYLYVDTGDMTIRVSRAVGEVESVQDDGSTRRLSYAGRTHYDTRVKVTNDELESAVRDALEGVESDSPYIEAERLVVNTRDDGTVTAYARGKRRNRGEVIPSQQRALDDAGLEWHFAEDGRFKHGCRTDRVVVTGFADDEDDSDDVEPDGGFELTDDDRERFEEKLMTDGGDPEPELETGERVIVAQRGGLSSTIDDVVDKRTGEIKRVGSVNGRPEYIVDLDGAGEAHVTRDALVRVADVPVGDETTTLELDDDEYAVVYDRLADAFLEDGETEARTALTKIARACGREDDDPLADGARNGGVDQ